jgi:hypothetical protein
MISTQLALLALDQYGEEMQGLPGVQGVGINDDGLVVYADSATNVADAVPAKVYVVTEDGCEVPVPVTVEVIGVIGPE